MKGFGFSKPVLATAVFVLFGSFMPAQAFDIQTMVIDSVSAHPEVKEKIHSFEQGIERRFMEETRDRISLKKEIEQRHAAGTLV